MSFEEVVQKLSEEMVENAMKDEAKAKVLADFHSVVFESNGKVDLGKLYDAADTFIKTFPEYSAALIAMCFLGGAAAMNTENPDPNDIGKMDIEQFIDGDGE